MSDVIDVALKVLTIIGMPSVVAWALYDRRRVRNEANRGELEVKEQETTLPNRVRSSSVVTLEAEIMALSNSFDTDRRIKDATIAFLQDQLQEARAEITARDQLIDALQDQVEGLKRNVVKVTRDLDRLHGELQTLRSEKGKGNHGTTR